MSADRCPACLSPDRDVRRDRTRRNNAMIGCDGLCVHSWHQHEHRTCSNPDCKIPWCHEHIGFETFHRVPDSAASMFDRSHLSDSDLAARIEAGPGSEFESRILLAEATRRWLASVREPVTS